MKLILLGICLLALLPFTLAATDTDPTPRLVYTEFETITLQPNQTQAIKLDASNFYGGVTSAYAIIKSPDGQERNIMLKLIKGDEYYGTWRAVFTEDMIGEHTLTKIILGDGYELPHEYEIEDRSFWIVGQQQNIYYDLIYTSMTPFTADLGDNITIKLDARDTIGIFNITATVEWHNGTKIIPLKQIQGDKFYGTYQVTFTPTVGDTLYNLTAITITNPRGPRKIPIENRQVYVLSPPKPPPPPGIAPPIIPLTPQEELQAQLKSPLLPTKLAFALMAILLVFLLISHKLIKIVMKW